MKEEQDADPVMNRRSRNKVVSTMLAFSAFTGGMGGLGSGEPGYKANYEKTNIKGASAEEMGTAK